MLLRVEVFPSKFVLPTDTKDKKKKLRAPKEVYVSGNTISEDGLLLTAGRKDCHVAFGADKTVSRRHMSLSFVSTQLEAAKNPSSDEERALCNDHGSCVTVQDSSKTGTFVVFTDAGPETRKAAAGSETESGDDETDDEGGGGGGTAGDASSQAFSSVSKFFLNERISKAKLQRVPSDGSLVLSQLSAREGRAIIQCGMNGSTLVVSRVRMNVAFTRIDKKAKSAFLDAYGPTLGVSETESFVVFGDSCTTHLVAKDRIENAKAMLAWLVGVPSVTEQYFEALQSRKCPNENLPIPSDFEAPFEKSKGAWSKIAPNRFLLSNTTMLSFAADDTESLCRSCGCQIVPLYSVSNLDSKKKLIEEALSDRPGCFFVHTTSSVHTKMVSFMKKKKIKYVTQKLIAKSVTKQEPLVDQVTKQPIGQGDLLSTSQRMAQVSVAQKISESDGIVTSTETRKVDATQVEPPNVPESVKSDTEEAIAVVPLSNSRKRTKRSQLRMDENMHEAAEPKRARQDSDVEKANVERERKGSPDDIKNNGQESVDVADEPMEDLDEQEEDDEVRGGPRKKLSKAKNGWFTAAPANKKERKAYRRTEEAMFRDYEGEDRPPPTATTAFSRTLVVASTLKKTKSTKSVPASEKRDFKRFRKNNVCDSHHNLVRIRLKAVFPNESEQTIEMEDDARRLEAERRQADALFSDQGVSSSIRSHFKAKKRGRRNG